MEAQVWALIGVLVASQAALVGTLFYLGGRTDALGTRLDARIDAHGADLGARIDAQGAFLGARIDRLDAKLDDHLRRHAG